ncbi:HAD-IC family P-type ATPase [Tepidiforma thermophila]|uniref:Cation-transporting ATPase E n=1 Tax=Tepidiforma thermophila (strain KCTC 52669 / CGMCC 1.13589 / G233) TaxID=2761530 RepID=A0A2A9HBW5_TEPT2|nr:HAD-IC family P-type ATPase [Tepidiforma thermophila]PFG73487.1 cation-transporting ATPase E [Tepidiforma thermophila]
MTQTAQAPLPGLQDGTALRGLTSAEAMARAAAGLTNRDGGRIRTDADVIRANVLTFFNVILGSLILALLAIGEFKDGFFVGIVVIANVLVATLQELKATRTLRELRALTAPQVTVVRDGVEIDIPAEDVVQGDLVHLKKGDQVVADGPIVAREAEIDESLLTGESESVKRRPGDELRSGSFCTTGDCYYLAEKVGMEAYAMRLTADARQLVKRLTPLQIRFKRILRVLLTATGVLAAALLIQYTMNDRGLADALKATTATVTTVVPTGLLLGMTVAFAVGAVRVSRAGAIVQDINAVEALNYVDVICLDKTGTITANRMSLREVRWVPGAEGYAGWLGAFAAASREESKTAEALAEALGNTTNLARPTGSVPFNSERRWSAVRLEKDGEVRTFVLGAPETVLPRCVNGAELEAAYREAAEHGLRGVVFAEAERLPGADEDPGTLRALALLTLADELRPEVRNAFAMMEQLGIEPKIISGDNPETVRALLAQLGIRLKGGVVAGPQLEPLDGEAFLRAVEEHSVFGRVTPALKARIVAALKEQGHFVAMVGDGANDVQALRTADVAVSMASGTSMTRAVAGIVLLNDSFLALIRGAKEATAVLGNAARLSKLFIAKSLYAYLIIVATNMLGLDFPFLPRHGSLTALLTLGIPAVFISISVPPPDAGRDFTRNVLRWALPASVALAVAAILVHLLTEGLLRRDIAEARTLVSLTMGITGLFFMVEVLGFQGASWRSLTRPVLTSVLGILLVAGFLVTIYTPRLRAFFDFTEVHTGDWVIVLTAVAGALLGQYLLSRYWQQVLDFLTAKPGKEERLRGRAI